MINFLPPEAREALKAEYKLRVLSLWAVLWAGAFFAVGVLLVPSYLLIRFEQQAFEAEHAVPAEAAEAIEQIEEQVRRANELADAVKAHTMEHAITALLRAVEDSLVPGITMESYVVERSGKGMETVAVRGVAQSREALIAFQEALEAREEFIEAEVPIEDFVKERELPFGILISVNKNFR